MNLRRALVARWVLAVVAAGLAACPETRAADPPVTIENVRVGLGGSLKLGTWTPVWVDVLGGRERFVGVLELQVPDDDGTPTRTHVPIVTEPGRLTTVATYVRPGAADAEVAVRVRDESGRSRTRDLRPGDRGERPPDIFDGSRTVVVGLGQPQGLLEVAELAGFGGGNAGPGRSTALAVLRPRLPGGLPGRWYGYDAAQVIVLDVNDARAMEAIRARGDGLRHWVRQGGHLVVAGASGAQVARELLGELLPALPTGRTRLNDLGAIESFAGSTTNPIPGEALDVAVLEEVPERRPRVLATSTTTPLVVRGAYGFGRVTVVGFDVDAKPFAAWKDKHLFWVRVLDLKVAAADIDPNAATAPPGGAFFQNRAQDLAGVLFRAMDRPPGVSVVPFGWVAFFIFLYILLIGPGDYFFLKKVVKRMEWTWVTFPLIVLGVGAAAYAAAYALKGTELKVVQVDAVDIDQVDGLVRGVSWVSLFSPENQDYGVSAVPLPIEALAPKAGAEPPRVPAGFERLTTWFGPPEPQLGGGSGLGMAASGYRYEPPGEAEALRGVRIPIWSTKSFTMRWNGPSGEPLIEADLVASGPDRIDGTLVNRGARPLRDAVLLFGTQVYDRLGTIAPGQSVTITAGSASRPLSGYLEERARGVNGQVGNLPQNAGPGLRLADLVRTAMFRDGMNLKSPTPTSHALHGLDLTGQLELERPMLVAEVDGPAAALQLDGGSDPRIDSTTVVRVILPLKLEAEPAP